MEKKNTVLLTIIAVATLLVVVVGATFAYFTAQNGASGSTTATVTTETIGAITVSNEDPALYLDLTAAQMQEGVTGSYWATKVKGAEPATNYASADKAVIAKLNVSGGGEETVYSCNFKITVDKTDVILAYGDAAVVFALENNAEILGVTSGSEIDYTTLLNEYTVNFTRVGDTEEDLPLVSVSMRVSNTEVEQGFAGETLTTTFTSSDLECEVVDESDVKTLSGTWRFNDIITDANINESVQFTYYVSTTEYGHYSSHIRITEESNGKFLEIDSLDGNYSYSFATNEWYDTVRNVEFEEPQEVSDVFYEWFVINAKPVIEVAALPTENIDTNVIYKTYEYIDVDSTSPTTLAAGTYRFNDVLSAPSADLEQAIDFTVNVIVLEMGIETIANCTSLLVGLGDGYKSYLRYYVSNTAPDISDMMASLGLSLPGYVQVQRIFVNGEEDWVYYFSEDIKNITITEDQEVLSEFYEWFAANAKVRGDAKYYKYVDGTWVEQ